MGLKLSRKIRSLRNSFLIFIRKYSPRFYNFLILLGSYSRFYYRLNKKKRINFFSKNLDYINKFEYKKTSQNNEDGIIEYLLDELKIKNVNFVEIGFDYYENNSLNILKKANKGLFIDGDNQKTFIMKKILNFFFPNKDYQVKNTFITRDNINDIILENFNMSDDIDFMSIDIDGVDYYIFEKLKFRPKIICIEYNFWFGDNIKCSIPYNENFKWEIGSPYSGASIAAICSLALIKDYHLVALESSSVNAFFVRGDLMNNFNILDPVNSFKFPIRYSKATLQSTKESLLKKELVYF